MFDDFKESQEIPYSLLYNAIKNNKLSHAYLIDGNNYEYAFDFIMSFVKCVICDNHFTNIDSCNGCNICKRIDDGNYTEIKIIDSDSFVIKKEQVIELQNVFSLKAVEGKKRIYIIKDCDKMNKQASNCILKFLEEPSDDIMAILFTNNISLLLPTIVSRCQLIRLSNNKLLDNKGAIYNFASIFCDNKEDYDLFVNDDNNKMFIDNILSFIDYYEKNKLDVFINIKDLWYNKFPAKEDVVKAISLILNFYNDVLKKKLNINDYFFNDYLDAVDSVSNNNSLEEIIYKLELCYNKYDELKYNVSINIFIDDFFVRLGEYNEYC